MQAKCPNCGEIIDLVGTKELMEDYGFSQNRIQYARDNEQFPDAWLSFGNRLIYLKKDIDEYMENVSRRDADKTVKALLQTLTNLPEKEREGVLSSLNDLKNKKP